MLKWAAAVVAVAALVVGVATGNPGAFVLSGLLFAYAFGGAKVQRILSAGGAAAGIGRGFNVSGGPGGTGVFNPSAGAGLSTGVGSINQYIYRYQDGEETIVINSEPAYSSFGEFIRRLGRGVVRGLAYGLNAYADHRIRMQQAQDAFDERMERNSRVQIGTWSNGEPMYMGLPIPAAGTMSTGRLGHIFRNALGHVNPSTAASQGRFMSLFDNVVSNPSNLRTNFPLPGPAVGAGVQVYTQTFRNGNQVWVYTRNGRVINGGVNPPGAHR